MVLYGWLCTFAGKVTVKTKMVKSGWARKIQSIFTKPLRIQSRGLCGPPSPSAASDREKLHGRPPALAQLRLGLPESYKFSRMRVYWCAQAVGVSAPESGL